MAFRWRADDGPTLNASLVFQESFVRGGPALTTFLADEGREDQITLKAGHHRPASEMPFKWRLAGGPVVAQH